MKLKLSKTENQKVIINLATNDFMGLITNNGNRLSNEDSALILSHKLDENLKLLVLADGVGSLPHGKLAAGYITKSLAKWFNSLPLAYINTAPTLKSLFWGEMRKINKFLLDNYMGDAAATLVCAVIGENETVIASSGDSRGYIVQDAKLKQVTIDHLVWFKFNDPDSIEKDDLRFMRGNSYISRCIGSDPEDYRPDAITIRNEDYEAIMLFTDGVTDVLSDEKIIDIYQHDLPENVLWRVIGEAINSDPEFLPADIKQRFIGREFMLNDQTYPGKDNASFVLYKKYKGGKSC